MCRRHQLMGCTLLTFGLGLLIGIWVEGGFWAHCLGFAFIIFGFSMARKK